MKLSILSTLVTVVAAAALPTALDKRDSGKPSSIIYNVFHKSRD